MPRFPTRTIVLMVLTLIAFSWFFWQTRQAREARSARQRAEPRAFEQVNVVPVKAVGGDQ